MNDKTLNPFAANNNAVTSTDGAMVEVESQRSMQEVKASMIIAKQFPRDEAKAMDRILNACTRPSLAETAVYAYPRGGQVVTGPSIRLAEAIAQNWGNLQFGIRELSQANGNSQIEAFAWDIENNTRQVKTFTVPHTRYSRAKGNTTLTDPRDIYEMVANQGARRLRACILGVIPGDVIDAAVRQAEITQANSVGAPEEQIKKLIDAFEKFGVTKEMLSKRLRKNLNAVIVADILSLKRVYQSIRDGMGKAADYFEMEDTINEERAQQKTADIMNKIQGEKQDHPANDNVKNPSKKAREESLADEDVPKVNINITEPVDNLKELDF
jgi:hypothetical protein